MMDATKAEISDTVIGQGSFATVYLAKAEEVNSDLVNAKSLIP
jgi:hypothetical protein